MKPYTWKIEDFGWSLRSPEGHPRATMIYHEPTQTYHSSALERDMPHSPAFATRKEAEDWAQTYLVDNGHLPADTAFA